MIHFTDTYHNPKLKLKIPTVLHIKDQTNISLLQGHRLSEGLRGQVRLTSIHGTREGHLNKIPLTMVGQEAT